ncbi:hypothetical protein ACJBU6_00441 [Exserohilum turcicum]
MVLASSSQFRVSFAAIISISIPQSLSILPHLQHEVFILLVMKDCIEWYNNDESDTCDYVRKYFGITPAEFTAWNPSLSTNCEPWYEWTSYCIVTETKLNATRPTTTSSSKVSSSTTGVATLAPSPTAWTALGCYVEDSTMPILEQNMNPNGDSSLTIPKCKNSCSRRAFGFAGVQKGNQCWCGSYVGGSWASNQTYCNSTCTGDKNSFCGGNGYLNVFKALQNLATTSASATSAFTTTSSASTASTAGANKLGAAIRNVGWEGPWAM